MTIKLLLLTTLVAVTAQSGLAWAQSVETVRDRVRATMLVKNPSWLLTYDTARDASFSQVWRNRAEAISIDYDHTASVQAATDRLRETTNGIAAGGGHPLLGVGDEALIFAGLNASGAATVYLRKSVATAVVGAPSVEIATQVAQLVSSQVY